MIMQYNMQFSRSVIVPELYKNYYPNCVVCSIFVFDMSLLLQTLMKILKKFRRRKLNEITIHFEQAVYQTMFEDSSLGFPISYILATSPYIYVNERSVSDYSEPIFVFFSQK